MARTFNQMVTEAMAAVASISPEEAHRRMGQDPHTLVIDVQDAADIAAVGTIPGAATILLMAPAGGLAPLAAALHPRLLGSPLPSGEFGRCQGRRACRSPGGAAKGVAGGAGARPRAPEPPAGWVGWPDTYSLAGQPWLFGVLVASHQEQTQTTREVSLSA